MVMSRSLSVTMRGLMFGGHFWLLLLLRCLELALVFVVFVESLRVGLIRDRSDISLLVTTYLGIRAPNLTRLLHDFNRLKQLLFLRIFQCLQALIVLVSTKFLGRHRLVFALTEAVLLRQLSA